MTRAAPDVLVLGGGPAGAATAIALARGGASVAVLTRPERPDRPRMGETLPPAVVVPLARLGVWDAFRADGHLAAPGTVVCWGAEQPYENDYILNPYGNGWHLDRARFDALLLRAAADAGAELAELAPGDHLEPAGSGWQAQCGGRRLRAPFVVDATGRAARIGRPGCAGRDRADRLVGLVRFGATTDREPRTILEATPTGWWYAAVLPAGRAVTAFFTDADLLPFGAAARERYWLRELDGTRLVAGVLTMPETARLHTAIARTGALTRCAGPNWLAVGDAARTLDPLSGQGLEAALNSAISAAGALLGASRETGVRDYVRRTAEQHRGHLDGRLAHYRREQRWPQRPFWHRRHHPA